MELIDHNDPTDAPYDGAAGLQRVDPTGGVSSTVAAGSTIQNTASVDHVNSNDDSAPTSTSTQGHANIRARGRVRAVSRGRGRGTASARGRGEVTPHGQSRTVRAKRTRTKSDDGLGNDNDRQNYEVLQKQPPSKRVKSPPEEPEIHPTEIYRRKTSLRDRLIKGEYEPQAIGMRAYNLNKAAVAAAAAAAAAAKAAVVAPMPPRDFLVPIDPRLDAMTQSRQTDNAANSNSNTNAADIQPNTSRIAYKSTPTRQLHFPQDLVLAVKQNLSKWEGKQHSEGVVFVVLRLVDGDVADMRVFSTLRNATAEALYTIVNEHPEAFASLRGVDDDGNEAKIEKSESAGSAIRDITARPNFVQVAMSTSTTAKSQSSSEGSQHANIPSSTTIAGGNDASVFVVKEEDPEIPWPQRIALLEPDVNSRFGTHLGGIPEPTYVFWGKYKISSFGLKMEARRADGAAVKVSVHLKNLRKPTYG